MNKKERTALIARDIAKHLKELKAIGYIPKTLEPLTELEYKLNLMATEECNGERQYTNEEWENERRKVLKLFKKDLTQYGFYINTDPRGYALKLDYQDARLEYPNLPISYQDLGGYGILCPQFMV